MSLPRSFYSRKTDKVAQDLLGCVLVRVLKGKKLSGKIVETEAYFGPEDPASRAYAKTKENSGMAKQMFSRPGAAFVYMVHANWLFNVVAKKQGAGAVLIRALEPIKGVEKMFENRRKKNKKIENKKQLCSGPGKLTQSLQITKKHSGLDLTGNRIWIERRTKPEEIMKSHRIGVTQDLKQKLRFFIKGNKIVSKK